MIEVSNFVLTRITDTLKVIHELYDYDKTILNKYFSLKPTCVEDTLPHPMDLLSELVFTDLTVFIDERVHDEDDLSFLLPTIDDVCNEETIDLIGEGFTIRYLEFSSLWIDKYIERHQNSDITDLTDFIVLANECNNMSIGLSQLLFIDFIDKSEDSDSKFKNHIGLLLLDSDMSNQFSLHDSLYLSENDKTLYLNEFIKLTKDMEPIEP